MGDKIINEADIRVIADICQKIGTYDREALLRKSLGSFSMEEAEAYITNLIKLYMDLWKKMPEFPHGAAVLRVMNRGNAVLALFKKILEFVPTAAAFQSKSMNELMQMRAQLIEEIKQEFIQSTDTLLPYIERAQLKTANKVAQDFESAKRDLKKEVLEEVAAVKEKGVVATNIVSTLQDRITGQGHEIRHYFFQMKRWRTNDNRFCG